MEVASLAAPQQSPPHQSLAQRMRALERANEVRCHRAALKRDLKGGRRKLAGVLCSGDPMLETMHVMDLLLAMPHLGRVKVSKMLARQSISPSKTIGGLTCRQRDALIALFPPAP